MTQPRLAYLQPGIEEESVAGFFRAAAKLYRARPWQTIQETEDLLAVTIEAIDLQDGVLSVLSDGEGSYGLSLFAHVDDFYNFLEFDPDEQELADTTVPIFTLTFEAKSDLPPELAAEIEGHRWELANREACPWLTSYREEDNELRSPTTEELRVAEAICLALPEILDDRDALRDALRGEREPLSYRVGVATVAGELEVVLSTEIVGNEESPEVLRPEHPLLEFYYDLESEEEINFEEKRKLDAQLYEMFAASEQGKDFPEARWVRLVLDLAAEHFATTITSLGPLALYEVLQELVPEDGRVGPEDAEELIVELRAFFEFLAEELGHDLASQTRNLLDDAAPARLREALVNFADA